MTNESKLEDLTLSKVLPNIMKFLGDVAKDDTSAYAERAAGLQADLLLTAILGLGKATGSPEGRAKIEEALSERDGHDPYGR